MKALERTTPATVESRAPRSVTEGTNEPLHHTATVPILQADAGVDVELLPWRRVRSASDVEVAEAIRAYNLAVAAWNAAELDSSQPLPRTLEHGRWRFTLGTTPRTRGIHGFRLPDGLCVYLKTRNWHPFPGGWSCARRVLAPADVAHAELRAPRMVGDHE